MMSGGMPKQAMSAAGQTVLHTARMTFVLLAWCAAITSRPAAAVPADPGMPPGTQITKLGDEVYLNGIRAEVIGIAVPASIKQTAVFFARKWTVDGWTVNVERNGDLIAIMAVNGKLQRVATLTKTGESSTEGSVSLTDIPQRMLDGGGPQLPVGEHLPKPHHTLVLNEVRVRDAAGESIFTTLANGFDVEQNAAFYQERMAEQGWKQKRHKTVVEGKSVIEVFERPGQEAEFTFVRQARQTFVTVNWINH